MLAPARAHAIGICPAQEGAIRKSSTEIYWINRFRDGNLAVMAAPRPQEPLEEKILGWKSDGVDCVISLIERFELPGLTEAEEALCEEFGIEFRSFPVRDKSVPSALSEFRALVQEIAQRVSEGGAVAIHCRAGIGRSTTLAACVLIQLGIHAEEAIDMIAEARGVEVPETEAQRQWILRYATNVPIYRQI